MRSYRKLLALLLALVLALGLLSGCGGNDRDRDDDDDARESAAVEPDEGIPDDAEPQLDPDDALSDAEIRELLGSLPDAFIFTSGAGAWGTELTIAPDGTFTGMFHDSEMGAIGDENPNGEVYICEFSGAFTDFRRVSDTVYTMRLERLDTVGTPDEYYIDDGIKFIYADPYGMDDADVFYLYLPGTPRADLPEGFLSWVRLEEGVDALPDDLFGLYNEGGEQGYYAYAD